MGCDKWDWDKWFFTIRALLAKISSGLTCVCRILWFDIYIAFAIFLRYFESQYINLVKNYFSQFSSVTNQLLFTLMHPICSWKARCVHGWGCSQSHLFKVERLFTFRCTQFFKTFFAGFLIFFIIN